MADTNVLVMNARVASDPETRTVGDQKVTEFRLACDTSRRKDDDETLFITGILWGREGLLPYIKKGIKVSCVGSLRQREWVNNEGNKRSVYEYVLREIDPFFGNPKGEAAPTSKPVGSSPDPDEIPFAPSVI
jgi:single-stranded DNA-binding protein